MALSKEPVQMGLWLQSCPWGGKQEMPSEGQWPISALIALPIEKKLPEEDAELCTGDL